MTAFELGPWSVEVSLNRVRRNGRTVQLEPKIMQVLVRLAEQPGEVVPKEELIRSVWSGTFVSDDVLTRSISELRKAFDDDPRQPRVIETIPKRGYRLLISTSFPKRNSNQVTGSAAAESASATRAAIGAIAPGGGKGFGRRTRLYAAAAVVVVVAVTWSLVVAGSAPQWSAPRRLTTNPTENPISCAALSAGGESLLYGDQSGLWLRSITSGEVRNVPLPAASPARFCAWLPDGTHVLVVPANERGSSLWAVSLFGGSARLIIDDVGAVSVSPDHQRLAIVRGDQGRELWLSGLDGSGARRIVEAPPGQSIASPSWSPDGTAVAFTEHGPQTGTQGAIRIAELRTGAVTTVVSGEVGAELVWLVNGELVYSTQHYYPDRFELWSVRPDRGSLTRRLKAGHVAAGSGRISRLFASADGTLLAYLTAFVQHDVYVGRLDQAGDELADVRRLTLEDSDDVGFAWTADSRAVIFASDRNGTFNLFRQDADAPTAEPVTVASGPLGVPRIDPTGTQLIYLQGLPESPSTSVRVMKQPLAGGTPRELARGAVTDIQCGRVPAATCAVTLLKGEAGFSVYELDPARGLGPLITDIEEKGGFLEGLSPDGSVFAVGKATSAGMVFSLIQLKDRSTRTVALPNPYLLTSFDWAADSKTFFACTTNQGNTRLLHLSFDGKAEVLWQSARTPPTWAIASADGRKLAFTAYTADSNVWLLRRP